MKIIKIKNIKHKIKENIRNNLLRYLTEEQLNIKYLMLLLNDNYEDIAIKLIKYLNLTKKEIEEVAITAVYYKNNKVLEYLFFKNNVEYSLKMKIINSLIVEEVYSTIKLLLSNLDRNSILLLEKNTDLSPIAIAVIQKDENILNLLIKKGFDINKKDINGDTPIMAALSMNDEYFTEYLIKNGASINIKANDGFTPMKIALSHENYNNKIVELILNNEKFDIKKEEKDVRDILNIDFLSYF